MNRLRSALPLLLLLAIGIALWASGALDRFRPEQLVAQQHEWRHAIAQHPLTAWGIYVALRTLVIATGMPASWVLILAGGFLFGILRATLLTGTGELLGSLLLYFAAQHAFGSGERPPPKFAERVRRGYQQQPLAYTLFLRLVPVLPFGGITVALAWLRCPLWLFAPATFAGGCVMAVFETAIGAGLGHSLARGQPIGPDLLLRPNVLVPIIALAVISLLPVLIQRVRAGRNGGRQDESQSSSR